MNKISSEINENKNEIQKLQNSLQEFKLSFTNSINKITTPKQLSEKYNLNLPMDTLEDFKIFDKMLSSDEIFKTDVVNVYLLYINMVSVLYPSVFLYIILFSASSIGCKS